MATTTDFTVPGTIHLVDTGQYQDAQHDPNVSSIVLHPQPSKDPEDPLNWSRRRKFWSLAMILVYNFVTAISLTLQFGIIADITRDTGISIANLVQGNGVMFLFLGWGCLFWQPIAITYGRRGVYLASTLLCTPILVWTGYTTTAGAWFAHRVLIGLVNAPIESLPEIGIADMFFAHERGTWMAVYVLFLFASSFVSPIIAGYFTDAYSWRWTMWLGACISATAFAVLFFGMEETMYFRNTLEGLDVRQASGSVETTAKLDDKGSNDGTAMYNDKQTDQIELSRPETSLTSDVDLQFPAPRSYLQKLKPFIRLPGRPSPRQIPLMMWRPLAIIILFPNILWSGFIYGSNLSWYNVLNGTTSPVLSASPYNWTASQIGLIYIGPIIGAIFGSIWSGWIADKWALYLARRNGGIREPEHRLWPLSIAGVCTTAGLILWGVGAYHHIPWIGLAVGLAMLTFGLIVGGSIGLSYAVDCFKDISGESMASVIIIRNTMGFGFSYAITPWYTNVGLQSCFIAAGFVSLACMATFLLMVWKGKDLRRRSAKTYWRYAKTTAIASH